MKRLLPVFAVLFLLIGTNAKADRPNILWITAEDMSPTLGCYGDAFATTPNIDRLAAESCRYTRAFATAPVCSPVRSCLINGCIATTQGTHAMRSLFPIPTRMKGFPSILRKAGYYTTNNVKTDYNSSSEPGIIQSSWDQCDEEAHWRNRKPGQPFFSTINLMTSHQSRTMVWPYEQFQSEVQNQIRPNQVHDPASVPLPPYYPDTPVVRKTVARYYDCVTVMDRQVGEILGQLEADGLSDDTIVFFFSDHGSGLPRHKRALFDSGMHVPLLIRFPKKFKSLATVNPGQTVGELVCFEDFAPTVLSLAGLSDQVPDFMRGNSLLNSQSRPYVFGHRDRVDEVIDMARSVRTKDFLYIRNFMPHLGYNQHSAWIDQGEIRNEFYNLANSGTANPAQAQFLNPTRPREELYDCNADPMNLHNLVKSNSHRATLDSMRKVLRDEMINSRDLGLVPEIELQSQTKQMTPYQWAQTDAFDPTAILNSMELAGTSNFPAIKRSLLSDNASIRYWATVSCTAAKEVPDELQTHLQSGLSDKSLAVRIESANALARHFNRKEAIDLLTSLFNNNNETVVLHAARTVELLDDPYTKPAVERLAERFENEPSDMAWFIRFTTSGYLSRH